jgi:outer membrane protein assembly factor BamA
MRERRHRIALLAAGALLLASDRVAAAGERVIAVEFEGARAIEATALRAVVAAPFGADSVQSRLERAGRLYFERGFLEATFTPRLDSSGTLHVAIAEGREARLAAVFLRGNRVIAEVTAREILGLAPGMVYRTEVIDSRLAVLMAAYAARGHLDAEATLERLEFTPQGVVLGIALAEGEAAVLSEVAVHGTEATRLVQRLSRLETTRPADARRIAAAPALVRRSGLFAAVETPLLYRVPNHGVGVLLRVSEAQRRHSVFGALGVGRDPVRDRAVLTGVVDVAFRNIASSGRDLAVGWRRDGLVGSRLAIAYRERFLAGSALDLTADVGQQVRDSSFTAQTLALAASLPLNRNLALEVGVAGDRAVFHVGLEGNTLRARPRIGLTYGTLTEDMNSRRFGGFEVRAESAWRRNDLAGPGVTDRSRVRQTLYSGRFHAGAPITTRFAWAARGAWYVLTSDEAEIPASELFAFGGQGTVRGYREEQFRGDQVAYGGIELRYGSSRAAQVYGFVDAGGLRRKRRDAEREASAHAGFGAGLRADVGTGALDLAFGAGDGGGFGDLKVHVGLQQRF